MVPGSENGQPCLNLLEATSDILRGLVCELEDDDARWRPAPDRFSIAEVLAHLSPSEGHCYRMRVDRFLEEDGPEFEPDDAQMWLDRCRDVDPEDAFDHFEDQRETNVNSFATCRSRPGTAKPSTERPAKSRSARCCMNGRSTISATFARSPNSCGLRKYLAGAGPLGASYQLKP